MNDSNGPRLAEILEGYFAEVSAGRSPDADALVARNPDLAEDLRAGLASLDFFRRARAPGEEPDACAGRAMGDFRIVREIGRGGMGVVYEAEQISLGRRVALKVLPFASILDPKQLQRFRNEAHAAANLHHTNIVPVYGVGSERGVHYYAMQYIEGESLAVAIGGMKGGGMGEGPRSPISSHGSNREPRYLRMAARLGVQAAEALDHAHQLGVVHRDIKPGNLLVDAAGTLWITDFGLARSRADAGLTMTGEIVGTLRYMSPEQALAKRVPVDHRTDIYSLGTTLYELFTLELAFPGENPPDVIHDVAFKEPVAARKLNPALPVDLETILMKAMSKDAAGRYATAQEMADDLRRFLDARPIQARPPTLPDRAWKWARRHRGLVLASSVVLLLGVVGLGVGAALLAREERRTRDEQRKTRAALDRANDNLRFAHEAVDEFLFQLGINGLKDETLPTPARVALMEKALQLYDTFLAEREEPEALTKRGHILNTLGRRAEALAAYDRALGIDPNYSRAHNGRGNALSSRGEALAAYDRAIAIDADYAAAHSNRGGALRSLGRFHEALEACDRAIEIDPDLAGAHSNRGSALRSLGRFHEALEAHDRAIAIDPDRALAHSNRGAALQSLRRFDEALAACDRALKIDPDCALAHNNRGSALRSLRRFDEALAAYDRAIAIDTDYAGALLNRGSALWSLGRFDDALAAFDRAIAIDPDLAVAHSNRGNALRSLGRFPEALEAFDRAIEIDPDLAGAHGNRGNALWSLRRFDDALEAHDRAIAIDPDDAAAHSHRGNALHSLGRFDDALKACDRAIAIDPGSAAAHSNRGNALRSLGRFPEALEAFDRAIEIDPDSAGAHGNRGNALWSLRRFDDALEAHDRAIAIDPGSAAAHSNRGNALCSLRRFDEALAAYDRALAIDPKCAKVREMRAICVQGAALATDPATPEARRFLALHYRELSGVLRELGHARAAAAAAGFAEMNPGSADSQHEAGVGLVACADMAAKDTGLDVAGRARVAGAYAEQAKAILIRACQLAPGEPSHRTALGRACVHAEDWSGAVSALDGKLAGGGGFEQFLLATAHAHLGHAEEARRCYDEGVSRMDAATDDSGIEVSNDDEAAGARGEGEERAGDDAVDAETVRAQRLEVERLLGLPKR